MDGTEIASIVAAGTSFVAAVSAIVAAVIAGRASMKTTRLAAQLAQGGELQKWRRDQQLPLLGQLLSCARQHLDVVGRCIVAPSAELRAQVEALKGQIQVLQLELECLSTPVLADAVGKLVNLHLDPPNLWKRAINDAEYRAWVGDLAPLYSSVIVASRAVFEAPDNLPTRLLGLAGAGT
jgi:hypothetical protein